jgi:hypothetical protein
VAFVAFVPFVAFIVMALAGAAVPQADSIRSGGWPVAATKHEHGHEQTKVEVVPTKMAR